MATDSPYERYSSLPGGYSPQWRDALTAETKTQTFLKQMTGEEHDLRNGSYEQKRMGGRKDAYRLLSEKQFMILVQWQSNKQGNEDRTPEDDYLLIFNYQGNYASDSDFWHSNACHQKKKTVIQIANFHPRNSSVSTNRSSSQTKEENSNQTINNFIIASILPVCRSSESLTDDSAQSIMKVQSAAKRKALTRSSLMQSNRINIPLLCKQLAYETPLELPLLKEIIDRFKHIIDAEPNLLSVSDPALVIGDIHGQFYDLIKILNHASAVQGERELRSRLVFLGDYVDRGINAVEVMVLLMSLKIEYPESVFLLRGNHESRIMTAQYNFRSECCMKYSQEVYDLMMDAFDLLPLACVVNNSYFCVHGGISDKMLDISKINTLARKMEIPVESSAYCDLIWADPIDNERGGLPSKAIYNESRDCSIVFGAELVAEFLAFNDLSTIIRGHEVFLEGFRTYDWGLVKPTPSVLTVFSAPNYCGACGNKAAVLRIEDNAFRIKQFREQEPEKYKFLVKFDVFSWTLPEIMKNVREIVLEMMESIVETQLPELKEVDSDRRLRLFVDYAVKEHLIEPNRTPSQVIKHREFLTAEEERNYLFNRSHEYYAESEKVPKHH